MIDETLRQFATLRQMEYMDAIETHGTYANAAIALKVNRRTIERGMASLKRKAAKRGWSPDNDMTKIAPPGYSVKGTSTLYDDSGAMKIQWVKTQQNKADLLRLACEAIEQAFDRTCDKVPTIPRKTKHVESDLLAVYPMGDPHIGMYAWADEAGEDFDVKIAERNLTEAMRRLVSCAPKAEQALIVNVGDFYHSDTQDNKTARSGHALDVDTRWANVLRVGVRAMRTCIELALTKHETVRVINEIGNHDDHTAQVLTLALAMAYENNPRVTFDESPARFHYFVFGDNLIGVTHGDTVKPDKLGGVMATDKPAEWGAAKHRYWYTGHIHQRQVYDLPGVVAESFRTLAAKDAWHAGMGYRSGRDMYALTLHRRWGEIERYRVDIRQIQEG